MTPRVITLTCCDSRIPKTTSRGEKEVPQVAVTSSKQSLGSVATISLVVGIYAAKKAASFSAVR